MSISVAVVGHVQLKPWSSVGLHGMCALRILTVPLPLACLFISILVLIYYTELWQLPAQAEHNVEKSAQIPLEPTHVSPLFIPVTPHFFFSVTNPSHSISWELQVKCWCDSRNIKWKMLNFRSDSGEHADLLWELWWNQTKRFPSFPFLLVKIFLYFSLFLVIVVSLNVLFLLQVSKK